MGGGHTCPFVVRYDLTQVRSELAGGDEAGTQDFVPDPGLNQEAVELGHDLRAWNGPYWRLTGPAGGELAEGRGAATKGG